MEAEVSVIIPTYNRAHLLEKTIPSYLQPGVGEIIIVDDASNDDTTVVIKRLQDRLPIIRYLRLSQNRKQMYAKNRGIESALYPFIYFGDDDSFITKDTIPILLEELKARQADVVGARALYMNCDNDLKDIEGFIRSFDIMAESVNDIVDLSVLKFNFTLSTLQAVEVPVTHACFLIRTEWARKVMFDENYRFNAYREETDFLVRANLAGARIYYQPKAIQVNLPRNMATGGAHAGGRVLWHLACIYNNWYFLRKNYDGLRKKHGLKRKIYALQGIFILRGLRKTFARFSGKQSRALKKGI